MTAGHDAVDIVRDVTGDDTMMATATAVMIVTIAGIVGVVGGEGGVAGGEATRLEVMTQGLEEKEEDIVDDTGI